MHINDAQREYDEFEFDIVNKEYSDNYAKGVITKQEQKPDTKTKNEVLEVWVSEGPKLELVPDVYDLDINAAKEELKKKGFNNFVEVKEESSEHRLDQVVRTNPERQTEVPLSTKIYIYVAVDKIESVEVPNVVTMKLENAINLLEKKGFVVAQPIEIPSDKPKGEVLKQDIPGGEWRDEGTEIILTISSGEKAKTSYTLEVKIPESFGDEEVTVKATLEGKSVKEENIYPKDIDYIWKIDIKGTDTQKVVIRINGEEYFKYNVNFEKQTAELTFDKTDTGEENPDEGQEPENNTSSNTESEENQEETTL